MKFIDLNSQYKRIKSDVETNIQRVLDSGQYILGEEVHQLEQQLADFVEAKHCVTVSSGTDALLIALLALNIGQGDEIITTPFSFIATAETIALLGATPVFVDIDPHTYNIDIQKIKSAITPKTKAIMPVNLYGQCVDFDQLNETTARHNLPIIEDAAQSFGATYKGQKSCNLATIGCTSFYPAKPLGCYGDGGACFTNDDLLAEKMRWIQNHGQDRGYHHVTLGLNGRMDTIQAAILLAKLKVFDDEVMRRQQVAAWYTDMLKDYNINTPHIESFNKSVWAQYTIQVSNRTQVREALKEKGIPTAVHYPIPLYRQPVFADLKIDKEAFNVVEQSAARVISLPFHPYMTQSEVSKVVENVSSCLDAN